MLGEEEVKKEDEEEMEGEEGEEKEEETLSDPRRVGGRRGG